MKARLLLIFIFCTILTVLSTDGKFNLFPAFEVRIMSKDITLHTELLISLIILFTLIGILIIGIIEKLFFSRRISKKKKLEE